MAGVDWALVVKVAGAGFGSVFLVLIILALVVWGASHLIQTLGKGGEKSGKE